MSAAVLLSRPRWTGGWKTGRGGMRPGRKTSRTLKATPARSRRSAPAPRCCGTTIFFYIAAALEEPHVWATLTEHDSVIFQDPDFEVFLDPDGDNHNYYEIEINALGTVWDLRLVKPYRDGGPALNEWHVPGLRKAVHVGGTLNDPSDTDGGWTVELALPWADLAEYAGRPVPPEDGDQWRVNFSRVEWDVTVENGAYHKVPDTPEHNWIWSPQGMVDMHRPERWGYVQFSPGSRPGAAVFRPDLSGAARDLLMDVLPCPARASAGAWRSGLRRCPPCAPCFRPPCARPSRCRLPPKISRPQCSIKTQTALGGRFMSAPTRVCGNSRLW